MGEAQAGPIEFERWFGSSKVVDERGVPLVVYHGTAAVFTEFKEGPGWYGSGMYFTPNPDAAADFARERALDTEWGSGDIVMPVYLALQTPYTFTVKSTKRATNIALLRELGFSAKQVAKAADEYHHLGDAIRHELEARGHDGLIVLDRYDGNEYVAFEPAQIRSAVGTAGPPGPRSEVITGGADDAPSWFAAGRRVDSTHDALELASGDAPYMLEDEDLAMEWRIALVPVDAVIDNGKAPEPERLGERLSLVRTAPRLERPIYELLPDGRAKIIDGWHRLQVAKERRDVTVEALVGRPSAVPTASPDRTTSPEFKQWFGPSTVVDPSGKPLVVHHGTDAVFSDFQFGEFGFHFGSRTTAEKRGPIVMSVHLRMVNPIRFDTDFSSWSEEVVGPYLLARGLVTEAEVESGDLQGILMAKGFDGYTYPNGYEGGGTSYAVFSPEQIKSVNHPGPYDPTSTSIYGAVEPAAAPVSRPASARELAAKALDFVTRVNAPKTRMKL
ncbi:hypothetical protein ACSFA0_22775 [Variovorax sp. LT1P1]|uniref:ADP-ribosyltransferase-containing protein n=1 Tax=Variovorax sp. LT1P1 TaxID=3443730 RepID=UPI003F44C6DD